MGVAEQVMEQYPTLSFLLGDPEIGPLLTKAVDPNTGFSPSTFQAKLYQTNWWKRQSATQREWLIKQHTDPGSARQEREAMNASVTQRAAEMGVTLSVNQMRWLRESMLANGQTADGPELTQALAKLWTFKDRGKGQIGAYRGQVMEMAKQYFSNTMTQSSRHGRATLDRQAVRIASGQDTIEGLQHRMQLEAMRRFPHMKEMLEAGMTPYDVVQPMREIVAEEMEYATPDQVNVLKNPVWRKLLGVRDREGKMRLLTESEVVRMAREQPTWWKTSNGRTADNQMASALLNAFGERKSSMS
jgi:hypothetical protein